jgi:predicted DNA-binding transcriptional regulator AlpA
MDTNSKLNETPGPGAVAVGRLALRLPEVAKSLGISRRALERERAAGRFPRPDLTIGRMPLWRPETVRRWVEGGGR